MASSVSTSRAASFLTGILPSPAVIRLACLRTIATEVGSLILLGRWPVQSATTCPTVPAAGPALPASASSRRSLSSLALASVLVVALTFRLVRFCVRRQRFTLGMAGQLRAALEASDPAKDAPALREALRDLGAAIEARHDQWPES